MFAHAHTSKEPLLPRVTSSGRTNSITERRQRASSSISSISPFTPNGSANSNANATGVFSSTSGIASSPVLSHGPMPDIRGGSSLPSTSTTTSTTTSSNSSPLAATIIKTPLAFTKLEAAIHITATVIVFGLIVLSVWLTIAAVVL